MREIHSGDIMHHFKGHNYRIICEALHTETGELLVVYEALYTAHKIYARPYDMFMSEVDKVAYPDCKQKYRFEKLM